MENLPRDLFNEILVWLPVKSLLRFRCVCKSWCQIIDSQDFIYSHLDKSSKNRRNRKLILNSGLSNPNLDVVGAIDINNGFQEEFLINFKMPYVCLRFAAYCNGLVLLNHSNYKFSVWNPSTRRELPGFPNVKHLRNYDDFGFRYDFNFGFGYDSTIDDYKVVLIISSAPSYHVYIFGFKSNCWRRIQPDFPYIEYNQIQVARDGHSFIDGCVHFLCSRNQGESYIIVAFDVAKETFSVVPLPMYEGQGCPKCLQVFEGCLSIRIWTEEKVDLYVKKHGRDEFTWNKLFSLTTEQSFVFGTQFNVGFRTLGYSKEGNKVLLIFSGKMYSYDLKETRVEEIETSLQGKSSLSNLYNCMYYVESLVSIKGSERKSNQKKDLARGTNTSIDGFNIH